MTLKQQTHQWSTLVEGDEQQDASRGKLTL